MKRFLLAVLFLLSGAADAAYPEKPINLVVAYSPGGGTDLIARAIAPYLEKYLGGGARIVVVHRPGAGGEIGVAAIANAGAATSASSAPRAPAPLRYLSRPTSTGKSSRRKSASGSSGKSCRGATSRARYP